MDRDSFPEAFKNLVIQKGT